ncbi:MAG: hypothetical protein GY754_37675 [bacterium]|nr:hypothetical protein [bacterium]
MNKKSPFKKIQLLPPLMCLLLGTISVLLGVYANYAWNPKKVSWGKDEFLIRTSRERQAIAFNITHKAGDRPGLSLYGSTDSMCDDPYLMHLDVNGDRARDLYFHHCGGHGFVTYEEKSGKLRYKNLGQYDPEDLPRVPGFWSREIHNRGARTILGGGACILIGIIWLIVILLIFLFKRHAPKNQPE